jgi:predicted dehydrogenase
MPLKIAIVGTGGVARRNYIPFLAAQPDVVLGYHNRTPEKAAACAAEFGGVVFDSLQELAAWQPDSILVLTSETCRDEIGLALLELGARRLFFEKPLVARNGQANVTEDDFGRGKQMLDLAHAKGCETAMVFNYRFFDQSLLAKQIVAERDLGAAVNVVCLVNYACFSHCIDLMHHFAGNVAEITGLAGTTKHTGLNTEAVDVAAALLLENGASGTLLGTFGMQWQHPLFELIFTFERGRLHLRDLDGDLEILDVANKYHERRSLVRDTSRWDQYNASFQKALQAYLDSLWSGSPPPVPGEAGLRELQVEAAWRRSIAQRRPVKLQEEFPL